MKPNEMHRMCRRGCHINGPKGWHDVPVMSGDYDLDATIMHRNNKNLPMRLNLYIRRSSGYNGEGYGESASGSNQITEYESPRGYGPRTSYEGYKGYSGDE